MTALVPARAPRIGGVEKSRLRRAFVNRGFVALCLFAMTFSIAVLAVLLGAILAKGLEHLDGGFLAEAPSRFPAQAGIGPALWGTVWVAAVCGVVALPLGVGTAVLLEEYRPKGGFRRRIHDFVQLNITNLAGVPSIVYGILGLTAFVHMFGLFGNALEPTLALGAVEDWYYLRLPFGRGVLAGGLTLMLVILPIVIIASQEALRAVPPSLRHGALALGATRWQTIAKVSLPAAVPGIMTGTILAMSRAIGEAAPLLVVAGTVYITFTPAHLMDDFTVMPLQIFEWAKRADSDFHDVAASGIVVLLVVLLSFNALAIFLRQRYQKPLS